MAKTLRQVLIDSLENLEEKSFKKFKNRLNDLKIKEEFSRIPKGKLEKADTEDVADLIRNYYMDQYGIEVTLTVLKSIDENQEAENLRSALKTVSGFVPQESGRGDQGAPAGAQTEDKAPGAPSGDAEHFVDRHRAALIQGMHLVSPVLDDLYQNKLLTSEQYDTVRSMKISQEQMRELYRYVESWGPEAKNKFLKSLRKNNKPLIEDLERKDKA